MRSIKLTTAIAAAAASSLAIIPAGALAAHRHLFKQTGQCHVRLYVAPSPVYAGETALAWGRVSCPSPKEDANQTVTLYQGAVGSPGFTATGTPTTTNKAGGYQLSTGALSADSRFYVVVDGVASARRTVKVLALVTLSGPAEGSQLLDTLSTGRPNRVRFHGTVSPEDLGAHVVLQRQNALTGNGWHRIAGGVVGRGGAFSIVHRFLVPGDANLRVLVRSAHRNLASPSNILTYEISQAQNPLLTIESSADPVIDGQPVAVSGTAAGAPDRIVTLLANSVHQAGGYMQVAVARTNSSGKYEFPVQTPVNSALYKVRGAGRTSAVLYEGVKDLLTATVSPATSSIQAGEALTFSGAVSPNRAGHVIYLERENAAGVFHVVDVSTITAGSLYTIAHTVYELGTNVFRVRIPGDAQNGGAISQTFTVQVTPASAPSALTPEAPGNSSLPPDGQV